MTKLGLFDRAKTQPKSGLVIAEVFRNYNPRLCISLRFRLGRYLSFNSFKVMAYRLKLTE